MNIGLLLVADENDILERVLAANLKFVDVFYVLDGTVPNRQSKRTCAHAAKCRGYWTDAELPRPPYPEGTVCGYRGFIYDKAVEDHGYDHWFVELHGDEIWTVHPNQVIEENPSADGFIFPLPFYFPRADEPWDDKVHPLDQLHWHMTPGWPEFRLFRGNPNVHFSPTQHFNTQPSGLTNVVQVGHPLVFVPSDPGYVWSRRLSRQTWPRFWEPNPLTSTSYFSTVNGSDSLWAPGSKNCR